MVPYTCQFNSKFMNKPGTFYKHRASHFVNGNVEFLLLVYFLGIGGLHKQGRLGTHANFQSTLVFENSQDLLSTVQLTGYRVPTYIF